MTHNPTIEVSDLASSTGREKKGKNIMFVLKNIGKILD
jgi:hypothetical protein